MKDLKIALIQADLAWEDYETNLKQLDVRIEQVPGDTHLVVLPEMFATGFSMEPSRFAQPMDGPVVTWMKALAQNRHINVTGSVIIREKGRFYNRLIWAKADGRLYQYDKKHLFRYAGEHKHYCSGEKWLSITCNGWKIRPFICYDLRFPIWTRNLNNSYDAAIFVANWPEQRSMHWRSLLIARAIENQCYVAGVNRVGVDGNGLTYSGDSCIIDPTGKVVSHVRKKEAVFLETLSWETLKSYRDSFPAWMDADENLVVGP